MIFGFNIITSFLDSIKEFYLSLPEADKLVIYVILILCFILVILIIILLEQKKVNRRIVDKKVILADDVEVLDIDNTEIDENNEKTRNLKEITDKIQAVIDNRAIDLTKFEQDQEENSIISYDELKKSVGNNSNNNIPNETSAEPFSLPNLVHKIEVDDDIESEQPYVDPIKEKESKFKSSVFISPVFGVQEPNKILNNVKEENVLKPVNIQENINKNYNEEEQFLNNLINFRNNLE